MKHIELGQSAVNRVIENLNASIKARYSNTFSLNSALYVVTNDFVTVANDGSTVEITPSPAYFTLEVAREIAKRPWVSESGKPAKMRRVTADAWHDGYGDSCIDTLTTLYQNVPGLTPIIVCEVSDAVGSMSHLSLIAHVFSAKGQTPYIFKFSLAERQEAVDTALAYNIAAMNNQPAPGTLMFPDGFWR